MIETLLEVRNLSKTFRYRTGWFRRQTVEAVKPLSFTLREGQTLAIIGENGSGKSTLAKMLAGMIEPTSGELLIDDRSGRLHADRNWSDSVPDHVRGQLHRP